MTRVVVTAFDISTSDIDWTDGETVTVKLFEGLEGGTLSDDATLSELDFSFFNNNPDDPMNVSDESHIDDFLTPAFNPEITDYTAAIPARYDALLNEVTVRCRLLRVQRSNSP